MVIADPLSEGTRKPDAAAFETVLDALGVAANPSTCVFVDDNAENVAAAEALGIDGVLYEGDAASLELALLDRGMAF